MNLWMVLPFKCMLVFGIPPNSWVSSQRQLFTDYYLSSKTFFTQLLNPIYWRSFMFVLIIQNLNMPKYIQQPATQQYINYLYNLGKQYHYNNMGVVKYVAKTTVKAVSWAASGIATAFNWVDTNITFGGLGWIGRNTFGRIYQFGNWIWDQIQKPKIVKDLNAALGKDEDILAIKIRSTWIGGETTSNWTKIASLATCVLNGMLVKHWWIVAKGRNSNCGYQNSEFCPIHKNTWYHFGFNKQNGLKGAIRFCRYETQQEADWFGRKSGGNIHEEADTLKTKLTHTPIKKAVEFAQEFDGRYDLAMNNCQTFAEGLYDCM